jgi:hypothetical protein
LGNEVVLGDGQAPGSAGHERTLAHELTHVVQQRSGPVDGTPASGGIAVSSPTDRFEQAAETTAERVMATGRAGDVAGPSAPAIQRAAADEEEVQELAIQRERGDEEEPAEVPVDVPRPEAAPSEAQEPEQTTSEAPSEVQRPEEEEGQAQRLAIQRAASGEEARLLR